MFMSNSIVKKCRSFAKLTFEFISHINIHTLTQIQKKTLRCLYKEAHVRQDKNAKGVGIGEAVVVLPIRFLQTSPK